MTTDFDPLRQAPLPDSFDRTADWLRSVPPRPSAARPLVLAAALALTVGACAWPVESATVLGWVVETETADAPALLRALDAAVPAEGRLSAEVEPMGGGVSAVRYVVLDRVAAGKARAAAHPDRAAVRLSTLDAPVRQPLGLTAVRWLGVSASPRLSDAQLQRALDRAFDDHATLAPRVERAGDGRRVLQLDGNIRLVLHPETRVSRGQRGAVVLSGGDLSGFTVSGLPILQLLDRAGADGRSRSDTTRVRALFRALRAATSRSGDSLVAGGLFRLDAGRAPLDASGRARASVRRIVVDPSALDSVLTRALGPLGRPVRLEPGADSLWQRAPALSSARAVRALFGSGSPGTVDSLALRSLFEHARSVRVDSVRADSMLAFIQALGMSARNADAFARGLDSTRTYLNVLRLTPDSPDSSRTGTLRGLFIRIEDD